jgi:hypothetical protein
MKSIPYYFYYMYPTNTTCGLFNVVAVGIYANHYAVKGYLLGPIYFDIHHTAESRLCYLSSQEC